MSCIMSYDYSLDQNDILKFVYCFKIIFLIYFDHLFIVSTL
jgi:hypothetical protein